MNDMRSFLYQVALSAVIAGCLIAAPLQAQNISKNTSPAESGQVELQSLVLEAAQRFALPETWIMEVIRAESNGNTRARSHKGAMGLMQLMPATWAELRSEFGLRNNPYDPRDNVMAGTAYLRKMYDRFGFPGCLAAYNAGPSRVAAWISGKKNLPRETIGYVNLITSRLGRGGTSSLIIARTRDKSNAIHPSQSRLFVTASSTSSQRDDIRDLSQPMIKEDQAPQQMQSIFVPISGADAPQ